MNTFSTKKWYPLTKIICPVLKSISKKSNMLFHYISTVANNMANNNKQEIMSTGEIDFSF